MIYICGTNPILQVYTMHAPIYTTHKYSMVMFSIASVCLSLMVLLSKASTQKVHFWYTATSSKDTAQKRQADGKPP